MKRTLWIFHFYVILNYRELGSNVADEDLKSGVENIYNFEMELAKVSF